MRLSVATNFDDQLLDQLQGFPVVEVFGKLPRDYVGGGRASYMLAPLSRRSLAHHVAEARKRGIRFNYLLNAACLGNREFQRGGQRRIERLLGWLGEIGVEAVTVSIPFMLELVKKRYPQFLVRVGVFARVATPQQARFWEGMGADSITLDPLLVNRDMELLATIREAVRCDVQLIPNSDCLLYCPLAPYHMVCLSHASQGGYSPFMVDYCFLKCTATRLQEPVNYVRAVWIRPEDIHRYESLGYHDFKILERNAPTEVMVERVRAYSTRHFQGNLLDLIQPYGYRSGAVRYLYRGLFRSLRHGFNPLRQNLKQAMRIRRLAAVMGILRLAEGPACVTLDNQSLHGFLDQLPAGCSGRDCDRCRYCHRWAEQAVTIDPAYRRECLALLNTVHEGLSSGPPKRRVV